MAKNIICFYLQKLTQKNNKQNKRYVPKKIFNKEIKRIKSLKIAGYLV